MDLLAIWRIVQVVLGIGLVIFVHEAGHFLAARWCKVRVHVFSLGFGPTLFGWKRGDTTYQVCAIPLGGYVRMAGDESMGVGAAAEPWELGSKNVAQRFLIFSGGVLANIAFGLVVFPILFIAGIPSYEPVVGSVERGSPAWHLGIEPGTRILEVNETRVYDLFQVAPEVAYNGDRPVELVVLEPGALEPRTVELEPVFDELNGFFTIGQFSPPPTAERSIVVTPGGAAESAGLRTGDHFLRIEGQPAALNEPEQLERVLQAREPIVMVVEREGAEVVAELAPQVLPEAGGTLLGVSPISNRLVALREDELTAATGLQLEDTLLSVEGRVIHSPADLREALLVAEGPIEWIVRRQEQELALSSPPLSPPQAMALYRDLVLRNDDELTGILVLPGSVASEVGLLDGDVITQIDGLEAQSWKDVQEATARAGKEKRPLQIAIRRWPVGEASPTYPEFEATPGPRSLVDYGFSLDVARYTFRVSGTWEAVTLGTRSCWNMLRDVWRTITGILRQDVSEKSVGGIITIGVFAHQTATLGWVKFFWFLCLLSMNLAFLNVLPIPLLDGGHLFFLLVEGIKGSPVNEKILGYSQLVGLVLIVSLFVFVIYNDLTLHVFSG